MTSLMCNDDRDCIANQAWIRSRFALLVRRRKETGAAPLRRLWLGDHPFIDPIGLQTLSQCAELEEINAGWSSALTAEDWARLAQFQQLRTLFIWGRSIVDGRFRCDGPLSDLGLVLPPLLHCRALRDLTLFGRFELRVEHAALLARIPALEVLTLSQLLIESLAPLSAAPTLTELSLRYCAGIDGEAINLREMIPPMPLVCQLTISDEYCSHLSASEAESLNVALLACLPKLTPERFSQY